MDNKLKFNELQKAIISTLAFFDIFDFPLTSWEIYRYLYQCQASYLEVVLELEKLVTKLVIENTSSFYFLPGRRDIIRIRLSRYNEADIKYKIALRATRWLCWVAGLKMVAVCNNLAYSNARPESDIDFFIITAKKRLWLTRLLITLVIQFLGLRRHNQKITSRICLSFYITEDNQNLESITLKPVDPYFYYWLATLTPIYGEDNFRIFWRKNLWLKKILPNIFKKKTSGRRRVNDNYFIKFKKIFWQPLDEGIIGEWLEKIARAVQLKKMSKNIRSVAKEADSRVVISDVMLKFHEEDRRAEFREKWQSKISNLCRAH